MPNDTTDDTSGIIIEADEEGFSPVDRPLASVNKPIDTSIGSGDALDALFAEKTGTEVEKTPSESAPTAEKTGTEEAPATRGDADNVRRTSEDDKHSVDALDSLAKAKSDEAAKADEQAKPAEQPKIDGKPKVEAPKEEPDDAFKAVQLPPHSKPPSRSAFDEVKRIARERIAAVETELAAVKAKVPAADVKIVTPEIEKELEELRAYKKAQDFTSTDDFKNEYVKPIEQTDDAISAKLKQLGMTDAALGEAKKIGYDKLDWDALLKDIPQTSRLSLQALILQREQLNEKLAQGKDKATKMPQELAAKYTEIESRRSAEQEALRITAANEIVTKGKLFETKTIPVDATPAARKELEEHNKFIKEQQDRFESWKKDTSPEMVGTLLAGTLKAYALLREVETLKAYKTRAETAEAELAKIKRASSTSRTSRTAPATPAAPKTSPMFINGNDALDALRAAKESERS